MIVSTLIQKFWDSRNLPRDDGASYSDQVEQFICLVYLKMTDGRAPAVQTGEAHSSEVRWANVLRKDGDDLFDHFPHTLKALGNENGRLGLMFNKLQNKFQDSAKPRRLIVDLTNEEDRFSMGTGVKDDAYADLSDENARDTKSASGHNYPLARPSRR